MPLSYAQTYGDGTTRNFDVPCEYLSKAHVAVRVDGESVPFTWIDTYRIRTNTAPAAGSVVEVRRTTPREERLVTFSDGSTLVETDLNTSTLQSFFLAQEAFDQGAASMGVTEDGQFTALRRRITNLADPVNSQDAVTKAWALNMTNTNVGAAIAAKDTAVAAKDTSVAAKDTAVSAQGISTANKDQTQLDRAATAADRVQTGLDRIAVSNDKGTVAADKATVAADKGTVAADKATVATDKGLTIAARDLANKWADEAEDTVVTGGKFSARHWAAKAAASAATIINGLAGWIHGATAKATPVDADEFGISDSAASWGLKKLTWANLKATLKTYFDGVYGSKTVVDGKVAKAGDTLTGGIAATAVQDGTKSTGTYSLTIDGGNYRLATNGGAFTIAAPTLAGDYTMFVTLSNSATAGVVTFTGFDLVDGDDIKTVATDVYLIQVVKTGAIKVAIVKRVK
jgi:Phage T7 tail fibre protein